MRRSCGAEAALSHTFAGAAASISTFQPGASPQFERLATTPLISAASLGLPSIYWPSIIRAADYLPTPLDTYYMYVSTDHGGEGGIWLLTAPKVIGPWTSRGRVFVDTTAGSQTETPEVQFINGQFDMLYQQLGSIPGKVANQVTLRATSPDGVTWTRQGIAIDLPKNDSVVGETHTGYQRRSVLGNRWVSRGRAGGSVRGKRSLWFSNNGTDFIWSRELDYGSPHLAANTMRQIDLFSYFFWRGQLWGYGRDTNVPTSGATLETGTPVVGPVTADLMSFAAEPVPALTGPAGAWENGRDRECYVYADGPDLYLLYQKDSSIGIARTRA